MEKDEVRDKMTEDTLEGKIYKCSVEMLENNREEIIQHFPDPALRRRNSGYAIDQLLYSDYFDVAYFTQPDFAFLSGKTFHAPKPWYYQQVLDGTLK